MTHPPAGPDTGAPPPGPKRPALTQPDDDGMNPQPKPKPQVPGLLS